MILKKSLLDYNYCKKIKKINIVYLYTIMEIKIFIIL